MEKIKKKIFRMRIHKNQFYKVVFIPLEYRKEIIQIFHTKFHLGIQNTYNEMVQYCYWENMVDDVKAHIGKCKKCQMKSSVRSTNLNIISANGPLELVHMDMMGPLRVSESGYRYICVVIDHYSKFLCIKPLVHNNAEEVTEVAKDFISYYGAPLKMHWIDIYYIFTLLKKYRIAR